MRVPPNRTRRTAQRSNENLVALLQTELVDGLTLARVAKAARQRGDESWEQSAQHAEEAYSAVGRFLANPLYGKRMTNEQRHRIEVPREELRKELDALQGSRE